MPETVQKRPYRSPRREQQAMATRVAILDAAQSLFEKAGYSATTIEAIASQAEVSAKTVYLAFVSKMALLRAVWERLLAGGLDAPPVTEQDWYAAMLAEPDQRRQIQIAAETATELKERTAGAARAIREASFVDPDGAKLWLDIQSTYYEHQKALVEAIADHGGLRKGLDRHTAADITWTLNHADVWLLMTRERGWTPAKFEAWFRDVVAHCLLDD